MRLSCCCISFLFLSFSFFQLSAQPGDVSYQQLKEYEGTYEYINHSTLQIAASPKDNMLYALVGDSKYKLRPSGKDTFLNSGNQQVIFSRDQSGVTGYTVKDGESNDHFKLITRNVTFSEKIWYAKPVSKEPFVYQYQIPADKHDGIATGPIWKTDLDTSLIHTMINRIVDGSYSDVHSILIAKDGKLVLEEYFYDNDINSLHQLRSATKSFTSAVIGIAIDKKIIKSKDEKLVSFFPEYKIENPGNGKENISIENMLTQLSGLDCNEDDQNSPGNEVKIYPTDDWVKYILNLPMKDAPGKLAQYCSGNVILLDRIIEKASRQTLHDFAQQNLFSKIGVTNFKWDFVPDKSHQETFGQLNLRSRDMLKFGLLYLNEGRWHDTQVIPSDWVKQSLTKHSVVEGINYGYLWWCEDLTSKNGKTYEGYAAKGNGGQRIFIWPKEHMVAVITAGNYNTQSPANRMLIECVLTGIKK